LSKQVRFKTLKLQHHAATLTTFAQSIAHLHPTAMALFRPPQAEAKNAFKNLLVRNFKAEVFTWIATNE
jgi:hypothetical protein